MRKKLIFLNLIITLLGLSPILNAGTHCEGTGVHYNIGSSSVQHTVARFHFPSTSLKDLTNINGMSAHGTFSHSGQKWDATLTTIKNQNTTPEMELVLMLPGPTKVAGKVLWETSSLEEGTAQTYLFLNGAGMVVNSVLECIDL